MSSTYQNAPFIYDGVVTGYDFCPRPVEAKRLLAYIDDSTNVLLLARRRMGKTSFVQEIFKNHLSSKIIPIYADLFDITDENDFAKALYRAIANALPVDFKTALQALLGSFKRVTFEIKLGADGSPEFSPKLASRNFDDLMADLFNGLNDYLRRNKLKAVFCIDEFQQIAQLNKPVDATLRKYIQHHHSVCYIFTGSKRHTLSTLFQGQKTPMMGMVTPFELGPIGVEEFYKFAKKRIPKLSESVFGNIYSEADGESKLVQHLCRHIKRLDDEKKAVSPDVAIQAVINEVDGVCRNLFESLPANSKKILKMISQNDVKSPLAQANLVEYNISKSSAQAAINAMLKSDFIYKDEGQYYVDGGLGATFALWCKHRLVHVKG
jgi:hypothetical protein